MSACEKHRANPVKGYSPCPGCEVETLRQEVERLKAALQEIAYSARTKTGMKESARTALLPTISPA